MLHAICRVETPQTVRMIFVPVELVTPGTVPNPQTQVLGVKILRHFQIVCNNQCLVFIAMQIKANDQGSFDSWIVLAAHGTPACLYRTKILSYTNLQYDIRR